jgi:hypothetical protein
MALAIKADYFPNGSFAGLDTRKLDQLCTHERTSLGRSRKCSKEFQLQALGRLLKS